MPVFSCTGVKGRSIITRLPGFTEDLDVFVRVEANAVFNKEHRVVLIVRFR